MKDAKPLQVAVLTQKDSFVVPGNVAKLAESSAISLALVMEISGAASVQDKAGLFLRGFGVWQFLQLGLRELMNKSLNWLDAITQYKLDFGRSLKSVAVNAGAVYAQARDPNDDSVLRLLESKGIDLIVSFSAPMIFESELLSLPKYGCLNLHCSLLPAYAGLLPSFWTLYHAEPELGVTVHTMGSQIDDGEILAQSRLPAPNDKSVYTTIKSTKSVGGKLMIQVVERIAAGEELSGRRSSPSKYYPWPSVNQIKEFRKLGGRLI